MKNGDFFQKHHKITGVLIGCIVALVCAIGSGHPDMIWEIIALHGTAIGAIIFTA